MKPSVIASQAVFVLWWTNAVWIARTAASGVEYPPLEPPHAANPATQLAAAPASAAPRNIRPGIPRPATALYLRPAADREIRREEAPVRGAPSEALTRGQAATGEPAPAAP